MKVLNAGRISAICFAAALSLLAAVTPLLAVVPAIVLLPAILVCFVVSVVTGLLAVIKGQKWAIIFPIAVVLVLGIALDPFHWKDRVPVVAWATSLHSERGSIDCGHTSNRADYSIVTPGALECARSAVASHRPFSIRSTAYGVDFRYSTAIIGYSDGHGIELVYGIGMLDYPNKLFKYRCSTPIQLKLDGFAQPHCAPIPDDKLERDFIVW